jgi:hypothetical protein
MKARLLPNVYLRQEIVTYEGMVRRMLEKPEPAYPWFRCVTPGFDNSARRVEGAVILLNNTPEKYGAWLREVIHHTLATSTGDRRIVFINAWNEWGEGNHLEPDLRHGRAFLEATRQALETAGGPVMPPAPVPATPVPATKKLYWNAISRVRGAKELVRHMIFGRD